MLKIANPGLKNYQRRGLLFLLVGIIGFTAVQPVEVFALFNFSNPATPQRGNVAALQTEANDPKAAPTTRDLAASPNKLTEDESVPRERVKELTDKRSAFTKTYLNKDGTKTLEYTPEEQNYKDGKEWKSIDNSLSDVDGTENVKGKAGKISATLKPLADGISVSAEGKTVTVRPVGARDVAPVKNGRNSVIYKDAWPNVDVEYELRGQMVKEIIIVKGKTSQTSFNFNVEGGKIVNHPTIKGALTIEGMPSDYQFSPLSLDVHGHGVISEQRVFQAATANGIAINLDKGWFDAQDDAAFPMRIDPTFTKQSQISYQMFKSDGFSCGWSNCYANTGSLNDGTGWKTWRSYINIPYTELKDKTVLNADLHGWYKSGIGGSTTSRAIAMGLANCVGYNCIGATAGTDNSVSTDFDIDFTAKLKSVVDADDYSSWWSIRGVESTSTLTYKPYYDMKATITYDTPTPMSVPAAPADKATVVTTQPSLRVNNVTDADGDAVKYYFRVTTNPDAETGAVINSGWIESSQWTVPDNILQDGRTYYWHVYTKGYAQKNPTWVRSFKVDTRTGKDSTQAYEDVGPLSVDLATGNATTGTESHSISALGGDINVSLNYNSPAMSRPGLAGQYWDNTAFSGKPTAERVDSNVDFTWANGSPSEAVPADNFSARWTGYLTAPTTGDYYFGCNVDDTCKVYVDNQLYFQGGVGSAFSSSSVHLEAGKPVSIKVEQTEITGNATMQLLVKGAVAQQTVPASWFDTGVRPTATKYGLQGRYYKDDGSKTFPADLNDPNRLLMVRDDTKLSFNWGAGAASPGLPTDNYLVRWKGYLTVPEDGTYTLGASGDDGIRLKLATGAFGADQTIYDGWSYSAGDHWGTPVSLTKNQPVLVTIEYYEASGNADFNLLMKGPGLLDAGEEMPATWLAPNANVLPDGWELGYGDGDVNYERLQVASNAAILSDSTGQTYEYTWKNGGYVAPKSQEATLTKNSDGTYTVIDTDGKTYIFDAAGKLASVSSPEDDKQPAALKYEYAGNPSRLTKIIDGVTPERYGTLHYAGDSECQTMVGFDTAPAGMLCAFKTTDGKKTLFQYKAGNLSRIVQPGDDYEDYGYDSFGRITSYRDSLANDAIAYGARANNAEALNEIAYDGLGRVASIKAPAPTPGANREESTIDYLNGATELHTTGASEPHGFSKKVTYDDMFRTTSETDLSNLTTTTEWHADKDLVLSTTSATGLKSTTIYNDDDLPTDSYGAAPAEWFGADNKPLADKVSAVPHVKTGYDEGISGLAVAYMAIKERKNSVLTNGQTMYKGDVLYSPDQRYRLVYQTDGNLVLRNATGAAIWNNSKANVASTRVVMQGDGNLVQYNGGTAVWATGTQGGGSGSHLRIQNDGNAVIYTNSTDSAYSWQTNTDGAAPDSWNANSLLGAPLLNTTGLGSNPAQLGNSWSASPLGNGSNYWGLRMTGKMYLPTTGDWTFRTVSDNGVRMYIDDQLVTSDWLDGASRSHPTYTFNNTVANSPHKIMIEYYHLGGAQANFALYMKPPGGSETANVTQYLKPNYSLTTSTTAYDSQLGDMTSKINYSKPEYGQASGTTLDPTGVNLQSAAAYETPGSGFLRQTSKTLPGGETTQYSYYSATDTRDNPCTPEVESILQAGFVKGKADPDPDGSGSATSITTESIYDEAGQVVALRTNNDPWTCSTFDERGRPLVTSTPGFDNKPGRTITNNYLVDSTPLKATTSDSSGTITTEVDLLGRMVMYKDAKGNVTNYNYDSSGKLASKTSPLGNETYTYDGLDRLATYKLDGQAYATVHYDQYNRLTSVDYPSGLKMSGFERDGLQRVNKVTYQANDTALNDEVTLSTSGNVLSGIENGVTKSYTYDTAGRLTGAVIGGNTFGYEFGAPDPSCSGVTGYNANANKSGNRTKYTLNGQSTTYCYDKADRLMTSSDAKYTSAQYDSHGNTTSLGDATHQTSFGYDANDRNTSITETYAGKTEKKVEYARDVSDRLLRRNYKIDGSTVSDTFYGYTADGDSPSFVTDGAGTVVQKYLTLPGGVTVTVKPQSTSAGAVTYSLSNMHGDTMATVNADGAATVQAPTGPFGEMLPSSGKPNNTVDGASFAHVGAFKKTTDTEFAITPTQMGARVYVAELGRFLQTDPVEGGTDNDYAYVNDPVNDYDLNGQWGFSIGNIFNAVKNVIKSVVRSVKKAVVATVKKVVKIAVRVVTAVRYVYTRYVRPVVRAVAKVVVKKVRAVVKATKKVVKQAAKKVSGWAKKKGDATSLILSVTAVGVCAATAGAACAVMGAAAVVSSAATAFGQSYAKNGSLKRAGLQALGSVAVDVVTGIGFGRIAKAAFGTARIGNAAVDLHGIPVAFGIGMGVSAAIDDACGNTSGAC